MNESVLQFGFGQIALPSQSRRKKKQCLPIWCVFFYMYSYLHVTVCFFVRARFWVKRTTGRPPPPGCGNPRPAASRGRSGPRGPGRGVGAGPAGRVTPLLESQVSSMVHLSIFQEAVFKLLHYLEGVKLLSRGGRFGSTWSFVVRDMVARTSK